MKRFAMVFMLIVLCTFHLSAYAEEVAYSEEREYSLTIHEYDEDGVTYYVLLRDDGSMVNEPTPFEIYELRGSAKDDVEVYACFFYDPDDHWFDAEMDAIYIPSLDYFSGFIYTDVQWNDVYISAAYGGDYGYLDMKGNVVIPFQWSYGQLFDNGIAKATYRTSYGYANAYIDTTGKIVGLVE